MMNYRICTFYTGGQKWQNDEFALFALEGKSGKMMNYRICTFCTGGQKWQNDEL